MTLKKKFIMFAQLVLLLSITNLLQSAHANTVCDLNRTDEWGNPFSDPTDYLWNFSVNSGDLNLYKKKNAIRFSYKNNDGLIKLLGTGVEAGSLLREGMIPFKFVKNEQSIHLPSVEFTAEGAIKLKNGTIIAGGNSAGPISKSEASFVQNAFENIITLAPPVIIPVVGLPTEFDVIPNDEKSTTSLKISCIAQPKSGYTQACFTEVYHAMSGIPNEPFRVSVIGGYPPFNLSCVAYQTLLTPEGAVSSKNAKAITIVP